MMLTDAIWLFLVLTGYLPAILYLAPTTSILHPCVSACGIGYASESVQNGR